MTYAKSGLFWSQCFLPSLVIRKAQAGAGKSSLGLLWYNMKYLQISKVNFKICKYLVLYRYKNIDSIYLNLLIYKTAGYLATLLNL